MKNQVRQTQMVMSFGPGSMLDLPDTSVMIAGLDHWYYDPRERQAAIIQEQRLLARLGLRFGNRELELRRPPRGSEDQQEFDNSVRAWRFPQWYLAATDRRTSEGFIERRLVHRHELNDKKFRLDGKVVPIIPIRFVRA